MIKSEANKKDLADHQKKYQKLEKENIELKTRFDEYSKANRKYRSKNEQLIKEIGALQMTNQQLQKDNQELSKSSKQLSETNRKLEAKINAGTKGQIAKYESVISRIKERNQILENEVVRLTDLSQNQAREIYVLNDALDTNLKDSNIEEKLVYEVSSLREMNKNSREVQEQQRTVIAELQNNLQTMNDRCNHLENQLTQYQMSFSETTGKLQQLEQLYASCQRSKADLEQEKITLLEQITKNASEIDNIRNTGNTISRDNEQLLEELNFIKNEFRNCSQKLHQVQESNNELRAILQNRESLINELSQKCNYLQQVEQDLRRKVGILTTENSTINSQLDAFSKMNYESQQVVSDTTMEISRLKDQVEKLQLQNQMLLDKIDKAQYEKKEDIQRYKDKLTEREEDLIEAKNEKRKLKEEMEQQAKELAEARLSIKKLEVKLDESEMKYSRLEEAKTLMQKTLLDQLNRERSRVVEVEGDLEKIQNTMFKMENDNNRMHILLKAQKRSKENNLMKGIREKTSLEDKARIKLNEPPIADERKSESPVQITELLSREDSSKGTSGSERKPVTTPPDTIRRPYTQSPLNYVSSQYEDTSTPISSAKYQIGGGIGQYNFDNSPTSHFLTDYYQSTPLSNWQATTSSHTSFIPTESRIPSSETPVRHTHSIPSPQYSNISMAAKRNADRYKGSDGKPLDLFALAYSTPSPGAREGAKELFDHGFESPMSEQSSKPSSDSKRYQTH